MQHMRGQLIAPGLAFALGACATNTPPAPEPLDEASQAVRVCPDDDTVPGIDVSEYQLTIDWDAVRADGIEFAFIRANHGLGNQDTKFDRNWAEAKRAGVIRGAYQYLEPSEDALAQAEFFVEIVGELEPGDLPPVLDVEEADALSDAQMEAAIQIWVDHVEGALGRKPIIYTTASFWAGWVGNTTTFADHSLWVANWNAACPSMPTPWARWDFWQTSESGRVDGIPEVVDLDLWNGNRAELDAYVGGSNACGDGRCRSGEDASSCAADCAACVIPATGGMIDDGPCLIASGPSASWRYEAGGEGGELRWTYAWDEAESNAITWRFEVMTAGRYRVEVNTPAPFSGSQQARYTVHHDGGDDEVVLDQSAHDGWQELGTFDFTGADRWVRLGDSTGESFSLRRQLVFDAIRLVPISTQPGTPDGGPAVVDPPGDDPSGTCGCRVGGQSGDGAGRAGALFGLLLVAGVVVARRRRASTQP